MKSLGAALSDYVKEQRLRKLRVTPEGELHPSEALRMMDEIRAIVHSFGEEIDGTLELTWDRWLKEVRVTTRPHETAEDIEWRESLRRKLTGGR